MAEIVDILYLTGSDNPKFTVNLAAAGGYVAATTISSSKALKNASGFTVFSNGDSFRILSMGFVMPDGFSIFKGESVFVNPLMLTIALKGDTSGLLYTIKTLSVTGSIPVIPLPMDNFEFNLDVFCNVTEQVQILHQTVYLDEDFELVITSTNAINISMLGVPAAFDTKVFHICPFIKILHNFQLSA